MSAKKWGNCVGGLRCSYDSPPSKRGLHALFKRGWRRLLRRQGKKDTVQRRREAA